MFTDTLKDIRLVNIPPHDQTRAVLFKQREPGLVQAQKMLLESGRQRTTRRDIPHAKERDCHVFRSGSAVWLTVNKNERLPNAALYFQRFLP